MKKDFHFGVTYCLSRIAGFSQDDAEIIATSAQLVDDSPFSAHSTLDPNNFKLEDQIEVWMIFHFLPGFEGEDFWELFTTRENSKFSKEMLRNTLEHKGKEYFLYYVGIVLHAYADTWAHQNFNPFNSRHNIDKSLDRIEKIKEKARVLKVDKKWYENFFEWLCDRLSDSKKYAQECFSIGHADSLENPDLPYNCWTMEKIVNNPEVMKTFKIKNPEIYIDAAENILKFLCELNEVDVSETRSINWLNEVFQLEESCENKRLKILSEKFVVNNPECDLILNYMGKNWLSSDATDKENYKNKKMWNMAAEKFRESCIANIGEFIKEKIVKENIMFYLPERHKIVNN